MRTDVRQLQADTGGYAADCSIHDYTWHSSSFMRLVEASFADRATCAQCQPATIEYAFLDTFFWIRYSSCSTWELCRKVTAGIQTPFDQCYTRKCMATTAASSTASAGARSPYYLMPTLQALWHLCPQRASVLACSKLAPWQCVPPACQYSCMHCAESVVHSAHQRHAASCCVARERQRSVHSGLGRRHMI